MTAAIDYRYRTGQISEGEIKKRKHGASPDLHGKSRLGYRRKGIVGFTRVGLKSIGLVWVWYYREGFDRKGKGRMG